MMEKLYTVTELARELELTPRAIRFYEDKGLLAPRRVGNTRVYNGRDRGRLILILRGKRLGFSLREIGEWLALYEADSVRPEQTKQLLDKIAKRLSILDQQRADLDATIVELREIERMVRDHLLGRGPVVGD